jgi:hypothetical protein
LGRHLISERNGRRQRTPINDWNAQHAAAEGIVLLPVKWETHAMPQAAVRPQASINQQLVRDSDLLVGLFWTKLGTSTVVAASGTVEEIDEFVAAGKPALLYFSSRPISPDKIDLKQHKKLRQFKAATYKTALVGSFASVTELRATLLRDLINHVRRMKPGGRRRATDKLEQASRLTELLLVHRKNNITAQDLDLFQGQILMLRILGPPLVLATVACGRVPPKPDPPAPVSVMPRQTETELSGWVDLHTHPMINLAFGGKLVHGGVDGDANGGSLLPTDASCKNRVRATSMAQAPKLA